MTNAAVERKLARIKERKRLKSERKRLERERKQMSDIAFGMLDETLKVISKRG